MPKNYPEETVGFVWVCFTSHLAQREFQVAVFEFFPDCGDGSFAPSPSPKGRVAKPKPNAFPTMPGSHCNGF